MLRSLDLVNPGSCSMGRTLTTWVGSASSVSVTRTVVPSSSAPPSSITSPDSSTVLRLVASDSTMR